MTDALAQLEAMQARIDKMAAREEMLLEALNDALGKADRKLLDDVRAITLEHEARRSVILGELQTLATRIGAFPASAKSIGTIETIEYVDAATRASEDVPSPRPCGVGDPGAQGGDWRTATRRIAEELSLAVNGHTSYRSSVPADETAA